MVTGRNTYAVRCFVNESQQRERRYGQITEALEKADLPDFVGFKYLRQGIRVAGEWRPIVKMDWASGETLDQYIENNINDSNKLKAVAGEWADTCKRLRETGIAHNDLQHGNVIIKSDGTIRLVDYDGIYLPDFRGQPAPEIGHPNYQHPYRKAEHYDRYVDHFSALVIYLSLLAVSADPNLWHVLRGNDDKLLLLGKTDFDNPRSSRRFSALKNCNDAGVASLATRLEEFCLLPPEQVPPLENVLERPASRQPSDPGRVRRLQEVAAVVDNLLVQGGGLATKDELKPLAQKSDLRNLVTREELQEAIRHAVSTVYCARCGMGNSRDLIFCANERCVAALFPTAKSCPRCRSAVPLNSSFCPSCGRQR